MERKCISYFAKSFSPDNALYLDTCLEGVGAVLSGRCYAAPFPKFSDNKLTIVHLEMINIVVALRVWGSLWAHTRIRFHCDNQAVVRVVAHGRTKDDFLAAAIRNIWLLCGHWDIEFEIVHIRGKDNVLADTLSRMFSSCSLSHSVVKHLATNFKWEQVDPTHFSLNLSL